MRVEGDAFMNSIARYQPGLDFGVAPVPVPEERLRHDGIFRRDPTWVTWSGGMSFVIPAAPGTSARPGSSSAGSTPPRRR